MKCQQLPPWMINCKQLLTVISLTKRTLKSCHSVHLYSTVPTKLWHWCLAVLCALSWRAIYIRKTLLGHDEGMMPSSEVARIVYQQTWCKLHFIWMASWQLWASQGRWWGKSLQDFLLRHIFRLLTVEVFEVKKNISVSHMPTFNILTWDYGNLIWLQTYASSWWY